MFIFSIANGRFGAYSGQVRLFWGRNHRVFFVFCRSKERVFRLQRREAGEGHSRRSHGVRRGAAARARVRRFVRRFRRGGPCYGHRRRYRDRTARRRVVPDLRSDRRYERRARRHRGGAWAAGRVLRVLCRRCIAAHRRCAAAGAAHQLHPDARHYGLYVRHCDHHRARPDR